MRKKAAATLKALIMAVIPFYLNGCHLPDNPQGKQVSPWQTEPLPPLDYKTLSGGKVTHYIPSPATPNNPADEAMLEACRELPVKNAAAQTASVVIKSKLYGDLPISALVVNNTIVLLEVSGVVRALRLGLSLGMPEVLYDDNASITLTPKSKWAVVGKKRVPLHMAYYWAHNGYRVMTFQDLQTVFHERDLQTGKPSDVESMTVSYEPAAYKLTHPK